MKHSRRLVISIVASAAIAAFPSVSHASFECNVSVRNVLVYQDGTVNVWHSGRSDYTHICNLNQDRLGVSPTVCAMWTSMLQQIKKSNGTAQFYFGGDGSCATLPIYGGSPAPAYIGNMS